ncbi:hypothetical protein PspLS_07488 [Pyricularia sp. CBS 133598]|nr:hypothetical protein PspLS_07488 [Pyricularia sp. CBS 133598]
MESPATLESKAEFFKALDAVWDDDQDEPDKEQSELRRRYRDAQIRHENTNTPHAEASEAADSQVQVSAAQGAVSIPASGSVQSAPNPGILDIARDKTIKGTPLNKIAQMKSQQEGLAVTARTASFIEETPAGGPRRNGAKQPATLRRKETSPISISSPSVRDSQFAASAGLRKTKRKRNSSGLAGNSTADDNVPEERRVFKDLSFFYIPNDDIAPARRRRIGIAQKFGAQWVRKPELATHIIVDNSFTYKDIESLVSPVMNVFDGRLPPAIVRENFQGDSVEIGFVVNPDQPKYHVRGCPLPTTGRNNEIKGTSRGQGTTNITSSQGNPLSSSESLQVKTSRRARPITRSQVTPVATPHREAEADITSDDNDVGDTTSINIIPSSNNTPDEGNGEQGPTNIEQSAQGATNSGVRDELTSCIEFTARFKNLPLDEDEDDVDSVMNSESPDSENGGSGSEEEREVKKRKAAPNPKPGSKDIEWKDRFACHRGGTIDSRGHTTVNSDNPNARTIEILQQMCDYYSQINDHWRTTAYRRVINTLRRQKYKITTEEEAVRLPSVGSRLAKKIEEIAVTDRLQRLEHALNEPLDKVLQLYLGIYGVGLAQARRWISRGFRTLDDLKRPEANLNKNQRMGLEHYKDLNTRIPRSEVEALGSLIKREAAKIDDQVEMLVGGSYRRGASSSGDVDFIVTRKGTVSTDELIPFLERLVARLTETGIIVATVAALHANKSGASKWHGCCVLPPEEMPLQSGDKDSGRAEQNYRPVWRRVDFLLVPETEYGAALIYFTGNDLFNRSIRLLASKKGMRLNQRGLYNHHGIHEEMLKDEVRTKSYMNAIVQNKHLFKDKVVLDVGCGTAILSMFAVKAGAKHVIGVDMSTIIFKAREIVARNGMADKITLIQGKMEEIEMPFPHVDIIISEWMGYFLLYESMLDTVLYARDRYLAKDGLIFPDKAIIYAAGIEDGEYKDEKIGFWDNVYGFDYTPLKETALSEPLVDTVDIKAVVTDPAPVLTLDLYKCTTADLAFSIPFSLTARRDDFIHALVSWFDIEFAACHKPIRFSTGPHTKYTHWKQTVFYLNEVVTVHQGEEVKCNLMVKPNDKNRRDLDIKLDYTLETTDQTRTAGGECTYKMC